MTMTTTIESPPPTTRQVEILRWVASYIAEKGYGPTRREICRAFGFASPNASQTHVRLLRERGMLTYCDRSGRTIRLTPAGLELVGGGA
jgi:repressor LexA